jgi:hypothetical protein
MGLSYSFPDQEESLERMDKTFAPADYVNENTYGASRKLGLNYMILDLTIYWVHLAPGAYVKGAIEYTTHAQRFYATGYSILSSEHHVY